MAIEQLDAYKLASGKTYKSDYGAMRSWVINKINQQPPYVIAKEKEVFYQENLKKEKEERDEMCEISENNYGSLMDMDEALVEIDIQEIDTRLEELSQNIKARLESGSISLSDYSHLSASLFRSIMKTPIDQQVAFFLSIEKQTLTKIQN